MLTSILATDYPGGITAFFAGMMWFVAGPVGSLATLLALPASLLLRPFHAFTRVTAWIALIGTSIASLALLIEFALTAHDLIEQYHDPVVIRRLMAEHRTVAIVTLTCLALAWLGVRNSLSEV